MEKDKKLLHEGHRARLRRRFEQEGLSGFEKHNILELLLFYAVPRADTNPLAHRLLERFGSLSGVFEASRQDLLQVPGVGERAATLLRLIPAVCRAYLDECNEGVTILDTTEKRGAFLLPKFVGCTNEVIYLLCLDQKCQLLSCTQLIEGTIDRAPILVRRIAEAAVRVNAAGIVLAHNHPQGFALPSGDDIHATEKVAHAMQTLSIRLLDHLIIAGGDFVSLADSGLLL